MRQPYRQSGLTIFEVLIALSIFALIGLASFRILGSVIDAKNIATEHSNTLGQVQKSLFILERDLEQMIRRDIRVAGKKDAASYLQVNSGKYKLEFTRGGWKNPLQLSRSSLQRVAYGIGPHPHTNDNSSPHFEDKREYLLRYYWQGLDRTQATRLIIQPLLSDVTNMKVGVLSKKGKHTQWPSADQKRAGSSKSSSSRAKKTSETRPIAVEFTFTHKELGELSRLYRIN